MRRSVVHAVFEQVAQLRPNHVAVEGADSRLTYAELDAAADSLARILRKDYSVDRGCVVGLYLGMSGDYVVAALGVAKAGGIFMPLDLAQPRQRQLKCLAKTLPTLVVSDSGRSGQWAALGSELPCLVLEQAAEPTGKAGSPVIDGDDGSYIMFTSGTSGEPKAILGSHKGLSHFVHWEVAEFGLDHSVRAAQLAPPTFDVSLRDIFVPLIAGGTLCIPPPGLLSSRELLDWLDCTNINLIHCVPSLFRVLLKELASCSQPDAMLTGLRHVMLAGEPLFAADVQKWRRLMGDRVELVNLYGPSETTLAKAFHRIKDVSEQAARMIPVGRSLPNTALLVIKSGELCDQGEIGEVYIKTPFMSKGYYRDPELTAQSFVRNPLTSDPADVVYRTGDFGRYAADFSVELLGRQDSQVKLKGIRIELAEIEQALLQHPAVEQVAAVAHPGSDRESVLTAYFTASAALGDADLRRHLRDWLPENMHPSFFVQMPAFPVNLHGKVNRRALPRPADLLYQERAYVAPANAVEEALAVVWDEVLDLRKIGVTHSFVELGGDSLKAMRVLARIVQEFKVDVTLLELFPRATVRDLAAKISSRQQARPASTRAGVHRGDTPSGSALRPEDVAGDDQCGRARHVPATHESVA
jgi:amino acid adenylation domain-containing protein